MPAEPFLVCHTLNVYRSAPVPKNLPCPEEFLVARLYVLVFYNISLIWLNYTNEALCKILNLLDFAKHALIKEFQWGKGEKYEFLSKICNLTLPPCPSLQLYTQKSTLKHNYKCISPRLGRMFYMSKS